MYVCVCVKGCARPGITPIHPPYPTLPQNQTKPKPIQTTTERFLAEAAGVFGSAAAPVPTQPGSLDALLDQRLRVGRSVIDEVIRLRTPGLFFRKVVKPEGITLSTGEHVPCE